MTTASVLSVALDRDEFERRAGMLAAGLSAAGLSSDEAIAIFIKAVNGAEKAEQI